MSAPKHPGVEVQLSGEDADSILMVMRTKRALSRAGVAAEEQAEFQDEALAGDYDNVISTITRWVSVS